MTAQPQIDTCAIAISRPPNGVVISVNTIEQFERNFIFKSKINSDSYICPEYPAHDCVGCYALTLCNQHDLTKVVGYLIIGIAKEWDTTCEPHKVKNSVKVRFLIGKVGVMALNTDKSYLTYVVATNQFNLAMKIYEAGDAVVCAKSLDDAYHYLRTGLPESIVPIMVGFEQPPEHYQNHYIQFDKDSYSKLKQQDIKTMMLEKRSEYIKYLQSIDAEECQEKPKEWQEPEPLQLKSEYVEGEYPIHAFPSVIGNAIKRSAYYHNVPLAVSGQTYLGELAYIAQRHIKAPSDKGDDGQPCSLFMLTIFPSGEGKDVCKSDASKVSRKLESENMKIYSQDYESWSKASKYDGGKTDKPLNPMTRFVKTTTQAIIRMMSKGCGDSFIWSTGEGGYLFSGYSLKSDTMGESISVLNDLVDTGRANALLRSEEDSHYFENKAFSLDVAVQDVVARPALNNPLLRQQGFLARVNFAAPKPLPHRQVTIDQQAIKPYQDEALKAYWAWCDKMLSTPYFGDRLFLADDNRIIIQKQHEAELVHIEYQNYIGHQVGKNGKYELIRAYALRTNQYVLRIAAILAYASEVEVIDAKIMRKATDLCKHSLNEWVRYYDTGEQSDSQLLLEFLIKQKLPEIKKTYIRQNAPSKLRNGKRLDDALEHLIDNGYITITEKKPIKIILNPKG